MAEEPSNRLGRLLLDQRGSRSGREVAAELGVSYSTYYRLEHGGPVGALVLPVLARYLDRSEEAVQAAVSAPDPVQRLKAGPWRGMDRGSAWTLTRAELVELRAAIPDRGAMIRAVRVVEVQDRKMGRALQILKRAGLARFYREGLVWVRVAP